MCSFKSLNNPLKVTHYGGDLGARRVGKYRRIVTGTRRGDVEHILQFGTGSDRLRNDLLLPVIVRGQLPDQALLLSVEQSRAGSGLCLNVLWKPSGRARGIPNGVRNRKDGNG